MSNDAVLEINYSYFKVRYNKVYVVVGSFLCRNLETGWKKTSMIVCTNQFLHVASKVQAGEGFLLLGVVLCPPLGLLLLLTRSLILTGGVGG